MNHGVLIIEAFLIALLARYAYRRREPDIENVIVANNTSGKDGVQIGLDSAKSINCNDNIGYECTEKSDENVSDKSVPYKYSGTDHATIGKIAAHSAYDMFHGIST